MRFIDTKTGVLLKNILLATDFSEHSEAVLPYAEALARHYGSKVFVAHVIAPETYQFLPPAALPRAFEEIWRGAGAQMSALMSDGRWQGIPHQSFVEEGEIGEVLRELVERYEIDLLVAGTRGRGGLRKFLLGSVAEEILRFAPCPVLTVGPRVSGEAPAAAEPRRIVYATDFTPDSVAAAPFALSLAQENQARLTLLHVMDGATAMEHRVDLTEKSFDRLRELVPADAELWCEPELILAFGSPGEDILRIAGERRADLIVLGVRSVGSQAQPFAARLPGPTAYKVVAEARCPVLTVRRQLRAQESF